MSRTPHEIATFAKNGELLTNEVAELAKMELDQGVPFGTHLTRESIHSLKKQNKTSSVWDKIKCFFNF